MSLRSLQEVMMKTINHLAVNRMSIAVVTWMARKMIGRTGYRPPSHIRLIGEPRFTTTD